MTVLEEINGRCSGLMSLASSQSSVVRNRSPSLVEDLQCWKPLTMQRIREDNVLGTFGLRYNHLWIVQNSKGILIICK
jgi:hypothetical protein